MTNDSEKWGGEERRRDDRQDSIHGLHKRLDTIDRHISGVREEQHKSALHILAVDKRIDLMEVQIEAAKQREDMLYRNITERLDSGSAVFKKLFDKFDQHTQDEAAERRAAQESQKKVLYWVIATAVSVLISIGMVMFGKVFVA